MSTGAEGPGRYSDETAKTLGMIDEFTDEDSRNLLVLLYKYVRAFEPDIPPMVEHLAQDLVQSLDVTTNADDEMYQEIARCYHWDRVSQAPIDRHDPNSPGEGIRRSEGYGVNG